MAVSMAEFSIGRLDLGNEAALERTRRERKRALIIPREHGAWGLLLVPLITGAGVALSRGGDFAPLFLLLTAALALFWLRTPLESWLGTSPLRAQTREERVTVAVATLGLAKVATLALGLLLWAGRNRGLWLLGAVAAIAFMTQALLKRIARHFRMLSEMVGTIGLTSLAPAAYYVVTGRLDTTAWILWLANLALAGNQIHYVQLRIHTARVEGLRARLSRGWPFALGQALMTIALTIACVGGLLPRFASLAFAPLLFRGWFYFIQKPAPLLVRRLGWSELTHAAAFCAMFITAFTLRR
jgi:YwiC-like protein